MTRLLIAVGMAVAELAVQPVDFSGVWDFEHGDWTQRIVAGRDGMEIHREGCPRFEMLGSRTMAALLFMDELRHTWDGRSVADPFHSFSSRSTWNGAVLETSFVLAGKYHGSARRWLSSNGETMLLEVRALSGGDRPVKALLRFHRRPLAQRVAEFLCEQAERAVYYWSLRPWD